MIKNKIVFFIFCLLPIFQTFAEEADFRLDGQAEPSTYIHGCVNAITGSFVYSFPDIVVEGPEPLSFIRHYCNNNFHDRNFGCGMSHNHATNTAKFLNSYPYATVEIEESCGDRLYFCSSREKKTLCFYVAPKQLRRGYTNCAGDEISGRKNIKNTIIKCKDANWTTAECTAYLGDGTTRYYHENGTLQYEVRPSGNRVIYKYDHDKRVTQIRAVDATGLMSLGWINFNYDKNHYIHVTASNGKKAVYKLEKHYNGKFKYYRLASSSITGSPELHYDYESTHQDSRKVRALHKVISQGGDSLTLDYSHNKVECVKVPGSDNKPKKIYSIDYRPKDRCTTAVDLYGGKTVYSYCDKFRLVKKDRHHKGKFYNRQEFFWGGHHKSGKPGRPLKDLEGHLITKGVANEKKDLVSVMTYKYDLFGNVLSETIAGNLTGNHPHQIIKMKGKSPLLQGHETYSRYFTYSDDGFNLVTSIKDDDGSSITLQYLPHSDRVIKKLTFANGAIVSREFFEYNHLAILTKKIVDDGDSEDPSNLSGVQERFITTILPNMSSGSAGFGKPASVIESYLDFENMSEKQLKKIDYTYGIFDLVTNEAYYDADDQFRYSVAYKYDSSGNLAEQVDAIGRVTQFRYNGNYLCEYKELLGSGFYTTYSYDKRGRLIQTDEHHASGEIFTTKQEYDELNRKRKDVDPLGNVTAYEYDDLGRLVKTIYPLCMTEDGNLESSTIARSYNFLDQIVTETDPCGHSTKKEYTIRGQITSTQFPDGSSEVCRYHLNGTLQKKINRNHSYSLLTYDSQKRLVLEETFSPDGIFLRSKKCQYKGKHLILEVDPLGNVTEYLYDGAGRKTATIRPDGTIENYAYDSLGRLSIIRNGSTQEVKEFDFLNRVTNQRVEDTSGKVYSKTRFVYDISGNCTKKITHQDDSQVAVHQTEFTSYNLPKVTIDPLGFETHFSYDFNYINEKGQRVLKKQVVDPLGVVTIAIQDARGKDVIIEKRNRSNQLLSSEKSYYDSRGLKVKQVAECIVDGNKMRQYLVSWSYDSLGRPVRVVEDPSGKNKCTSMTYTSFGSLESKTKPDGVKISHSYDDLGREVSKYSSDGTISYTYIYDMNDHLIQSIDHIHGCNLSKQYDVIGNVISEDFSTGYQVSMAYDQLQRITHFTLQDGSSIAYEYDPVSMSSVKRISKEGDELYTHLYDAKNWEQKILTSTLITGEKVHFKWDLLGRPISIRSCYSTQEVPVDGFDAIGNLLKVKFSGSWGEANDSYKYDDLNQLIYEQNISTHTYQYDSLCNRLKKDESLYDLNSINQITNDGDADYHYDANGNLLSDGSLTYQYDALNRLVSVKKGEEWAIEYRYDSYGRCILRNSGNKSDHFIYQGLHEIGSFDHSGKIQELRILGQREGFLFRLAVAVELGDKVYAPVYDHRFNVIAMIDNQTKRQVEFYRYSAYGDVEIMGPKGAKRTHSELGNPWLYGSKRYDPETDLYNYGKRYYRPGLGRWISPDPGDFIDGLNLYAFTHNRPMICTDFYGFQVAGCYRSEDGKILGFPEHTVRSFGRAIECFSHHAIPVHQIQYVGEGVGRFLQDKSFSHEYTGDIKPVSGKIGHRDMGNQRVRLIPGIMTHEADAKIHAEHISKLLDGGEVYYTCHQSKGFAADIIAAGREFLGKACESLKGEYQEITNDYLEMQAKYGNDFSLNYIPHSRGALEFDLLSADLQKEIKQKMNVYTLGCAKAISKGDFNEAVNYANNNDAVVKVGQIASVIAGIANPSKFYREHFVDKPEIVYTGYKSDSWSSPVDDHMLDSEGYRSALRQITRQIKGEKNEF